jgi:hypothetical protein
MKIVSRIRKPQKPQARIQKANSTSRKVKPRCGLLNSPRIDARFQTVSGVAVAKFMGKN